MNARPNIPDRDRLRELLDYCPEAGEFRWKHRTGRARAGDIAGTPRDGYTNISVDGRLCRAHMLAWLYMAGEWPAAEIDHINRVKNDNRFSNLRLATRAQNSANTPARSGLKGVTYAKHAKKWMARINSGSRTKFLGYFDSPEAAHEAYMAAARDAFGEFATGGQT